MVKMKMTTTGQRRQKEHDVVGEMMPGDLVDESVRKLGLERETEEQQKQRTNVKQRLTAGPSPPRRPVQEART